MGQAARAWRLQGGPLPGWRLRGRRTRQSGAVRPGAGARSAHSSQRCRSAPPHTRSTCALLPKQMATQSGCAELHCSWLISAPAL